MGSEPLIDKHGIPWKILAESVQKNPEKKESVLMDFNCIEALLGLPEFRVIAQVLGPKELKLHRERRENAMVCPRCQTSCSRVKESRPRCIRDLPIRECPVMLWRHLRRFACPACRHRPWEKSETFGRRTKWTEPLSKQVRTEFLRGCPGKELARRYGLCERTVFRWPFERGRGGRPRKLGRASGIDAYSRRKGHRSNTLIVNMDTGKPIVTFQGRRADDVVAWLRSRPQEALARVEVVVADMAKPYAAAIKEVFGEQVQVIDRFHVVPQAVDAFDAVLRAVKNQLDKDEAKELKKLRKRWLKSSNQLHVDEIIARYDWCRRFPALRETLKWVQDLRKWFDRTYEQPAREALLKRIERAPQMQAGVRPASHCPGPPSPRNMGLRQRPRHREPRGEVRAAAVSFASFRLAIPCAIVPPQRLQTGGPETSEPANP
jgi:transposase